MGDAIHLAHLINPVAAPLGGDFADLQPLTFESMRLAAERARGHARVELLTAQYPEDRAIVPRFFRATPDLDRSAADMGRFTVTRKLPLLRDLLDRLYAASDAPYLVYTNVDIIVHPTFYEEVARRIREGRDAMIINRRRIPATYRTMADLPAIFAQRGKPHPGFDCFIFHRSLYPSFELAGVCIGIPHIEILFAQNLFCHARRFELFDRDVLTYHVGLEIFKKRDPEYLAYNKRECWRALEALFPKLDSRKFPWGGRALPYRMLRWGMHPAIPIRLALRLEPRRWRRAPPSSV